MDLRHVVRLARQPVLSSELLGFAPDARVLILNADDFGMYHAVNAAVVRSIEEGVATSCSLMVPCPWALHAMKLLRDRPEIPFGVHLTLVVDVPHYRWGPLSPRERVSSLLDETGQMFGYDQIADLLAKARLDEIELEFRAQINAVVDAGLMPTHLDFHSLADGGREDILDLTVALAEEFGLAVRVWLEPGRRKMRVRGLPVVDHPFLDSTRLPVDDKPARFHAHAAAIRPPATLRYSSGCTAHSLKPAGRSRSSCAAGAGAFSGYSTIVSH
jgi:predicted glycoside hydrolase/deacetylase ChbG (UPF0249 family)